MLKLQKKNILPTEFLPAYHPCQAATIQNLGWYFTLKILTEMRKLSKILKFLKCG